MIYLPNQKPPIWGIDSSIVAYNCMRHGFRTPSLYLPMWRKAGDTAFDIVNRQHMVFGVGAASPTWNGGVKLSTEVQYLSITNPAHLIFPDTSFSFIVRFRCIQSAVLQYIVNKNYGGVGVKWWAGQINNAGKFEIMIDDGNLLQTHMGDKIFLDSGDWHTCVGVRNREKNTLEIYTDGKLDGTPEEDTTGTIDSGVGDFYIGSRVDGDIDRDFAGDFDFLKVFPYALTAGQVAFDFANPYFMLQIPEELHGCSFFI